MGKVFVGHDWAEDHHDVYVEDGEGRRSAVAGCPRASRAWPGSMSWSPITSRTRPRWWSRPRPTGGCSSVRWSPPGYTVLAVNPMSTSRYRERHSTSGAKSDPGDAQVLAELARTRRSQPSARRR